ncbi:MAG: ROK family transcriptional regulator [Rhizobium sp.]|nr:MAG: ROK family transcriptional regulator [Rhizobium sp.]
MLNSTDRDGTLPGTNLAQTRALNRRAVFDAVRRNGPVTRMELAQSIGLTVQAISNIASELEVAGLIRQQGKRAGQRGQPAVELSLDPTGGYTIGLSLAYRRVSGVLVDLAGNVVASEDCALTEREPHLIAEALGSLAVRLLDASDIARKKIWGVGCSVPGTVENGTFWYDKVQEADEWTKFPLMAKLEEHIGIKTFVENDATVAAIGEGLYGIGRVARSFFYLHFNLGVGGGLVLDGHPYRGAFGGAGEIGHMIVKPGGRLCPCGSRGCLEQYVSFYAAAETVCGPTRTPDEVPAEELIAGCRAGDARLLGWQREAGQYLRIAIRNVEAMFDPDTIVIGGGLPAELLDGLIDAATPLLPTMTHRHSSSRPRLMRAEHAAEMPALGAAALPLAVATLPGASSGPWRVTMTNTPMAANPALAALGFDIAWQ